MKRKWNLQGYHKNRRYEEISSGEIGARLDLIDFSRLRFQSADEETIDTKSVKKRELMKVTKRKMNKVKSKEPEISQTLLMVQKKESNKRRKRKNPSKTLYLNNPACQRFTKTRNYISKSKLGSKKTKGNTEEGKDYIICGTGLNEFE